MPKVTSGLCLLLLFSGCVISREPIRPPGPIDARLFGSWVEEPSDDGADFVFIYQIDGPWAGLATWSYPMQSLSELTNYRGFVSIPGEQHYANLLVARQKDHSSGPEMDYMFLAYKLDSDGRLSYCTMDGEGGRLRTAIESGQLAGMISKHEGRIDYEMVEIADSSGAIASTLTSVGWDEICKGSRIAVFRRYQ